MDRECALCGEMIDYGDGYIQQDDPLLYWHEDCESRIIKNAHAVCGFKPHVIVQDFEQVQERYGQRLVAMNQHGHSTRLGYTTDDDGVWLLRCLFVEFIR